MDSYKICFQFATGAAENRQFRKELPSVNKRELTCVFSLPAFSPKREPWTPHLNAAPDAVYIKLTDSRSIIISACFLSRCCELNKASRFYTAGDVNDRSDQGWRSPWRHHPLTGRLKYAITAGAVWRSFSSFARIAGNGNKIWFLVNSLYSTFGFRINCDLRPYRPMVRATSAMSFSAPLARGRLSGPDCLSASEFPGHPQRAFRHLNEIACGADHRPVRPASKSRKLNL